MSMTLDDSIKRWTENPKSALMIELFRARTMVTEASSFHVIPQPEMEGWVDDAKRGMENALRAHSFVIR